jgi:hypothetical protein
LSLLVVVATLVAFVAVVAVEAALTVSVFASTTVGASADPLGCQTGTNVCPVVHDVGCTLLVMVVADAATPRPYWVMPDSPLEPLPPATHVHTAGLAAVQERKVLPAVGCAFGSFRV